MLNKIYSILLIIVFITIVVRPLIVVGVYYYTENISATDKPCYEEDNQKFAKMRSNGDTYLKALLKRVCKDSRKDKSKLPSVTITVFIKDLIKDHSVQPYTTSKYNEIPEFMILNHSQAFPLSLLRPPNNFAS